MAQSLQILYFKIQDCDLHIYRATTMATVSSEKKPQYKIRQVAVRLDIAVETIRMYEREGLLLVHKTATGQRLFDESDVHWIGCIRRLIKEKGLNLEGIRRLLALIPCWQLRPCAEEERRNCPAYLNATLPCWMIKTELSGNCPSTNCRDCPVYQSASNCDNLKMLLRQAQSA